MGRKLRNILDAQGHPSCDLPLQVLSPVYSLSSNCTSLLEICNNLTEQVCLARRSTQQSISSYCVPSQIISLSRAYIYHPTVYLVANYFNLY